MNMPQFFIQFLTEYININIEQFGGKDAPLLMPSDTEKYSDNAPFHLKHIICPWYHNTKTFKI